MWFCHPWEPATGAAPKRGGESRLTCSRPHGLCGVHWLFWQEGSGVTGSGSRSSWTGDGRW